MAEANKTQLKNEKVGIVGSGLIGRSWAMLFAAAGYNVTIYDILPEQIEGALVNIKEQLVSLESAGLLRGTLSVEEQHQLISGTQELKQCVTGAKYVQECVPEQLDLKKKVFTQIDEFASDSAILASSTSSMPASTFTADLKHKTQCVVAHPINPPTLVSLVEVVPTPWTRPDITQGTVHLLKDIGQSPVVLKKEVPGFAVNRLQYALLNECYRLVQDDAISVEDIDKVMSDGLGMRYAFIGPFETAHLNAEGWTSYCERYGEMIYNVASSFGPVPKWEGPTADFITSELVKQVPLDKLVERRQWRDSRLAGLAKLKKKMGVDESS